MQRIQLPEYELYLIIFQCIINMYQQYIFQNVFSVLYLNIVHSSPFDRGIWKSPSLFFFWLPPPELFLVCAALAYPSTC